jgi:uncharacterized membrane protein (UPF0127 family)
MNKILLKLVSKFDFKRFTFFIFSCIAVLWVIVQAPENLDAEDVLQFNRDLQNYNVKVQILSEKHSEVAQFNVAVADNEYKKMYGLMNLDKLPENYGMLFPFFKSQMVSMWMRATHIPLDILFIDKNNVIVTIKTNATPYSLDLISSEKEVKKVLEINGGSVEKFGIKVGQKVIVL